MSSIPVLAYHSIAPGERVDPPRFEKHLDILVESGFPSLSAEELPSADRGYLLTFDDGFGDVWTQALPMLQARGIRAVVFAIPSRAGEGPPRPPGGPVCSCRSSDAHAQAARASAPHPAFLRWSELQALEGTGLITVQSHSFSHRMGWVEDEILGFHLGTAGRAHWSLPQATGGDERLGVPLYRRGSALAHRLYFDDPGLRDRLADQLADRGGPAYVRERGPKAVSTELRKLARAHVETHGRLGRWETDDERTRRTTEELARAREALESRLGGRRDELCLPWGEYDATTISCARTVGIGRVYTLDRGANPAGRVGFLVRRFEPRPKGRAWMRSRLWVYRSAVRASLYATLSRRTGRKRG